MLEKVDLVIETLTADTDNPVLDLNIDSDVSNDADDATAASSQDTLASHRHHSLKTSLCTRWNSMLTKFESVLDLLKPAGGLEKDWEE